MRLAPVWSSKTRTWLASYSNGVISLVEKQRHWHYMVSHRCSEELKGVLVVKTRASHRSTAVKGNSEETRGTEKAQFLLKISMKSSVMTCYDWFKTSIFFNTFQLFPLHTYTIHQLRKISPASMQIFSLNRYSARVLDLRGQKTSIWLKSYKAAIKIMDHRNKQLVLSSIALLAVFSR